MADERVEHVIAPAEEAHEAVSEAAVAAVAAAEAAAALAHETAAHAELQAAEEVADVREEVETWQTVTSRLASEHGETLRQINSRLSEIDSRAGAQHEAQTSLHARLDQLESRLPPLTPPPSEEATEPATTEPTEALIPASDLAGAEVAANLGPASVSSEASLSNPIPASSASQRVKRRWL